MVPRMFFKFIYIPCRNYLFSYNAHKTLEAIYLLCKNKDFKVSCMYSLLLNIFLPKTCTFVVFFFYSLLGHIPLCGYFFCLLIKVKFNAHLPL